MSLNGRRRKLLNAALGLAVNRRVLPAGLIPVAALAACGESSTGTAGASTITIELDPSLTPTSATALRLVSRGISSQGVVTVQYELPSGIVQSLDVVRVTNEGVVVVGAPIVIDSATGRVTNATVRVQVVQAENQSNWLSVSVREMPSLESAGVKLGEVSEAVLTFAAVACGQAINKLEAIQASGGTKDTQQSRQELKRLLAELFRLRAGVQSVLSGQPSVLLLGTTDSGSAIQFDSTSLDILDRYLLVFLTALGLSDLSTISRAAVAGRVADAPASGATKPRGVASAASVLDALAKLKSSLALTSELTSPALSATNALGDESHRDNIISAVNAAAGAVGIAAIVVGAAPAVVATASAVGLVTGGYLLARSVQALVADGGDTTVNRIQFASELWGLIPGVRVGSTLARRIAIQLAGLSGGVALAYELPPEQSLSPLLEAKIESAQRNQKFKTAYGRQTNFPESLAQLAAIKGSNEVTIGSSVIDGYGNFRITLPSQQYLQGPYFIGTNKLEGGEATSAKYPINLNEVDDQLRVASPLIVFEHEAPPPQPATDLLLIDFQTPSGLPNPRSYSQLDGRGGAFFVSGDSPNVSDFSQGLGYWDSGYSNSVGWILSLMWKDNSFPPPASPTFAIVAIDLALFESSGTSTALVRPFATTTLKSDQSLRINDPIFTRFNFTNALPSSRPIRSVGINIAGQPIGVSSNVKFVLKGILIRFY